MSQVKVTAKNGVVVIESTKTPGAAYVRVETNHTSMENGWLKLQKRSALIRATNKEDANGNVLMSGVDQLKSLNLSEGQVIPGKIYAKESNTPFSPNQAAQINPRTKVQITANGQPIYRETLFTADLNKADELLVRDKVAVMVEETTNTID